MFLDGFSAFDLLTPNILDVPEVIKESVAADKAFIKDILMIF
jgi:hypothetical protein